MSGERDPAGEAREEGRVSRLMMDSVAVVSPGGEQLQVELAAALDRTCPPHAGGVVLKRPDQEGIGGFRTLRPRTVDAPAASRFQRWRWLRRGLPEEARELGADAAFVAGGVFTRRLLEVCGVVSTTNNLAPFVDASFRSYPFLARLRLRLARHLIVRSLRTADRLVLHSRYALETLSGFAGDLAPKTEVVLTGIPRAARRDAGDLPGHPLDGRPYFFYLSALRWYKNHPVLIEAYRRLVESGADPPDLLFAGPCPDADYRQAMEKTVEDAGLGDRVRYLGRLPGDEIAAWLHHATVNVFPSLCETNSVIVSEILGLGGVLAASDILSVAEVVDDAGELFDPHDPDRLAAVLAELWRRPERREELRRRARRRADELSWDACGRAIWRAAGEAASLHRQRRRA